VLLLLLLLLVKALMAARVSLTSQEEEEYISLLPSFTPLSFSKPPMRFKIFLYAA